MVLEQIPTNAKFDKETREQLLDISRRGRLLGIVPFRCFYSSVARSAPNGQAERANQAEVNATSPEPVTEPEEKMPTDKLVDVSPLAPRMSSPFNPHYWLSAVNDNDSLATA